MTFDDTIEWPNGEGFTPCTRAYADVCLEMDALKPDWLNLDDLSSADYQRWNELDNMRCEMMANGHLGKSHRYGATR